MLIISFSSSWLAWPGNVHLGDPFVEYLGAAAIEVVDQFGDGSFIAGNDARGEDDRVALFQLDLFVVVHGDADQGTHRLALAAGGDDADLLRRQIRQLFQIHKKFVVDVQVPQLPGDLDVFHHRAAVQQDLSAIGGSRVGHLLYPVDAAGEGGHDDAAPAGGENLGKCLAHVFLGQGVPLALHVGGIGKQRQDTRLAVARKTCQVSQLAVHRGLVELEIAGMDHHPFRRGDGQGAAVHDGVGHTQELHPKTAEGDGIPGFDDNQFHGIVKLIFLQLFIDESQGESRAVDRHVQFPQNKGQRADMILVAVGQTDGADILAAFAQPGNIRNHVVDSGRVRAGKHQAAVNDDNVVAVLVGHHVEADFAQTAQRDDLQGRI